MIPISKRAETNLCLVFSQLKGWQALSELQQFLFHVETSHAPQHEELRQFSPNKLIAASRALQTACKDKDLEDAWKAFDEVREIAWAINFYTNAVCTHSLKKSAEKALDIFDKVRETASRWETHTSSGKPSLSKRAADSHIVGDKIQLKGFGKLKFEVVSVEKLEDGTYYKVTPVHTVYAVHDEMVAEERHSEMKSLEAQKKIPLSKRADETPVIPIGEGYAKREINKIREENQRKIEEEGLDRPPQYPEKHTFFGEQFLPGDIIVTKKDLGKPWKVVDRHENKRLGVAYNVQSMEEALIWAQDVAKGMKGGYLLDLPKSEWDVPGKGLPPIGPKIVEEPPKRLSKQQQIEEENKQKLSGLNSRERAQEEFHRQRWFKLAPLAKKLIERLEPLAKGQDTFKHPNWELKSLKEQLAQGYRARLVHQFESAIKEAYWALKGIPAEEGWKRSK